MNLLFRVAAKMSNIVGNLLNAIMKKNSAEFQKFFELLDPATLDQEVAATKQFDLLETAISSKHPKILEQLLTKIKKLEFNCNEKSPLLYSAIRSNSIGQENANLKLVKMLIQNGISIKDEDYKNISSCDIELCPTPLLFAIRQKQVKVVEFLLSKGANVCAVNGKGQSTLHLALDQPEMIELLLKNYAHIDAKDKEGRTPLHVATIENKSIVVNMLIKARANVNSTDKYGLRIPLMKKMPDQSDQWQNERPRDRESKSLPNVIRIRNEYTGNFF